MSYMVMMLVKIRLLLSYNAILSHKSTSKTLSFFFLLSNLFFGTIWKTFFSKNNNGLSNKTVYIYTLNITVAFMVKILGVSNVGMKQTLKIIKIRNYVQYMHSKLNLVAYFKVLCVLCVFRRTYCIWPVGARISYGIFFHLLYNRRTGVYTATHKSQNFGVTLPKRRQLQN